MGVVGARNGLRGRCVCGGRGTLRRARGLLLVVAAEECFQVGAADGDVFQVERGDTLRSPVFTDATGGLATFDCVIANPPFSLEKWGEDLWLNDPFGRNFAGLPPSSSGDFAWVQHMVKSMANVTGRMAVVLPQGALFRKGAEGEIRQKLLKMDLVEAVIEAMRGDKAALVAESSDLLYHLLVLWADRGVRPEDVWAKLKEREGISGIAEKAARREAKLAGK